jgi:hypothetical protein
MTRFDPLQVEVYREMTPKKKVSTRTNIASAMEMLLKRASKVRRNYIIDDIK